MLYNSFYTMILVIVLPVNLWKTNHSIGINFIGFLYHFSPHYGTISSKAVQMRKLFFF